MKILTCSLILLLFSASSLSFAADASGSKKGPTSCFEQTKIETVIHGKFRLNLARIVMNDICEEDTHPSSRGYMDLRDDCEAKIRSLLLEKDLKIAKFFSKISYQGKRLDSLEIGTDDLIRILFSDSLVEVSVNASSEVTEGSEDSYISMDDTRTKFNFDDVTNDNAFIEEMVMAGRGSSLWRVGDKTFEADVIAGPGFQVKIGNKEMQAINAVGANIDKLFFSNYLGEASGLIDASVGIDSLDEKVRNAGLPRFQIMVDASKSTPALYMNQWFVSKKAVDLVHQKQYPLNTRNEVRVDSDILNGRGHLSAIYSFGCRLNN